MKKKIIGILSIVSIITIGGLVYSNTKPEVKNYNKIETKQEIVTPVIEEEKSIDNSIYNKYNGCLNYTENYNLDEEDTNIIYGFLADSLFTGNDYNTISEVLYAFYNDYNYTVDKIKKNNYRVTFNMKFEWETTEDHKIVIDCNFDTNEYQIVEVSVDSEKINNQELLDNYITSLNETYVEPEADMFAQEEQVETNTIDKNAISNMFMGGFFYGTYNGKNITNGEMLRRLNTYSHVVNDDGTVSATISEVGININVTFAKETQGLGYWRIVKCIGKDTFRNETVTTDPQAAELILLEEIYN